MPADELAQLELLSELDALLARLGRWADAAPDWQPAETCRAMVGRLQKRIESMRVRWEAPLVVALLGGTGTGKSALINAILGDDAVETGRRRPTTIRPTLVLHRDVTPEMLSIDPGDVELVVRDLPVLRDLVLIDCPDPDTTEEPAGERQGPEGDSNLARLRKILPHCDVLVVTATQQKYRSARVEEELAAAAAGARLVFVQTHADVEDDIRDDWRTVLADGYSPGHIFLVDSLSALVDAQENRQPRGEFAQLVDLLSRELAGAAGKRIRRANFLDLLADTLAGCRRRLDEAMPPIEQAANAIRQQRGVLASLLARQMQAELLTSRRSWENKLLSETASRWGLSPFALVLRIYQGLGSWAMGALLLRARTPAQIALWGSLGGVQAWRKRRLTKQAEQGLDRAAAGFWDQAEVRKAGLILEGYATEAGIDRRAASASAVSAEAEAAGANFIARAAAGLQAIVTSLAARHSGWFARCVYELLFCGMIGLLLFRLGKDFFYDSWLGQNPTPPLGLDFYVTAAFWLVLWCFLLIFALTRRLRRGLGKEIDRLAVEWQSPATASGLFAGLEGQCRGAIQFRHDLDPLEEQVNRLRRQLAVPGEKIGHRV
jgi:hypothetical protein